jgi:hypothetical protein
MSAAHESASTIISAMRHIQAPEDGEVPGRRPGFDERDDRHGRREAVTADAKEYAPVFDASGLAFFPGDAATVPSAVFDSQGDRRYRTRLPDIE